MYKYLLFLLCFNCLAAEPIRVAIIDTGLDIKDPRFSHLICDEGTTSKSFVPDVSLKDTNGHGTHVAGLIKLNAEDSSFCFIILKYYLDSSSGTLNLKREVQAVKWAINNKASIINISGGGPETNKDEENLIKNNPKITFIVAAGNENQELNCVNKNFYPACYNYPNLISVGCIDCLTTNYGEKIKAWESGNNLYSTVPKNIACSIFAKVCGMLYMTGTSQATAVHTGKLIYQRTHP